MEKRSALMRTVEVDVEVEVEVDVVVRYSMFVLTDVFTNGCSLDRTRWLNCALVWLLFILYPYGYATRAMNRGVERKKHQV